MKANLLLAIRNLRKSGLYSAINLVGLSLGMAACMIIALHIYDEYSFDTFHTKADRIYRVNRDRYEANGNLVTQGNTAYLIGPSIQQDLSGVAAFTRIMFPFPGPVAVQQSAQATKETGFLWVDSNFFEVFDFEFVRGSGINALKGMYDLVITESFANKYFGESDPIGQTLTIVSWMKKDYVVTGIIKDPPHNSHLQFQCLASMAGANRDFYYATEGEGGWGNNLVYTYVLLQPGVSANQLSQQLDGFVHKYYDGFMKKWGSKIAFSLQPLLEIRHNATIRTMIEHNSDGNNLKILAAIALFTVLIAGFNYINLSTALANRRNKEIGVRKVMGASRWRLFFDFMLESALLVALAFVIAFVIVELSLPFFNTLWGKNIGWLHALTPEFLRIVALLYVLVVLLAGTYPALVLAGMQPVQAIKGLTTTSRTSLGLRKGLVGLQFFLAFMLLGSIVVIYQQLRYTQEKKLGFERDNRYVISCDGDLSLRQLHSLRSQWLTIPGVQQVSYASGVPGLEMLNDNWPVWPDADESKKLTTYCMMTDEYALPTLGMQLLAGRDFTAGSAVDSSTGFLINETAVKAFGWPSAQAAIGRSLYWQQGRGKRGVVIGVVADMHVQSLHKAILPTIFHIFPERYSCMVVHTSQPNLPEAIGQTWKQQLPMAPFTATPLDAYLAQQYGDEQRVAQLVLLFSSLAVSIACLGVLGLTAFATEKRKKEIGMRRVLGASVANIMQLFLRESFGLFALAWLLAAPVVYYLMQRWLQRFAYHIDLSPQVFALTALVVFPIVAITIMVLVHRITRSNLTQTLRSE